MASTPVIYHQWERCYDGLDDNTKAFYTGLDYAMDSIDNALKSINTFNNIELQRSIIHTKFYISQYKEDLAEEFTDGNNEYFERRRIEIQKDKELIAKSINNEVNIDGNIREDEFYYRYWLKECSKGIYNALIAIPDTNIGLQSQMIHIIKNVIPEYMFRNISM